MSQSEPGGHRRGHLVGVGERAELDHCAPRAGGAERPVAASSIARRVLPTPPGPTRVTTGAVDDQFGELVELAFATHEAGGTTETGDRCAAAVRRTVRVPTLVCVGLRPGAVAAPARCAGRRLPSARASAWRSPGPGSNPASASAARARAAARAASAERSTVTSASISVIHSPSRRGWSATSAVASAAALLALTGRQQDRDPLLERADPQLLESPGRAEDQRNVGMIAERGTSPCRQRRVEQPERVGRGR